MTDFRSIVAFRNILVHAYAQVDDAIIWDIAQTRFPLLLDEVSTLLGE